MLRPACRFARIAYITACVAALAIVPLSNMGAFGLEPDPLSGVFAVALSMPWSLLASRLLEAESAIVSLLLLAAGMVANAIILLWACKLVSPCDA